MKKILIGLWGILQGIIGTAWSGLGFVFILHPDSGPGTKDGSDKKLHRMNGVAGFCII